MEKPLFTHLSTINQFAQNYYARHHSCLDFYTIIQHLYNQHLLSETPLIFRRSKKILDHTQFYQHALEQVVDARMILSNQSVHNVNEEYSFSEDKDIYTMITLPFIHSESHHHNYYELLYVYEGDCIYHFQNKTFPLHQGQLLILSPDTDHYIEMSEHGLGLTINIRKSTFQNTFNQLMDEHSLLSTFFADTLHHTQTSNYITFNIENTSEYDYLIQQIFDESNSTENHSNMICISLLNLFFGKLLQDFGNTIHLYSDVKNESFNSIFPLMLKYVYSNYATISLPVMSQIFHYNESYISQLFKKYLNQNFSSIVQELRLNHARSLLETTSTTLEKIAEEVGYHSPDHLSRIFKKTYGVSPSVYRKNNIRHVPF